VRQGAFDSVKSLGTPVGDETAASQIERQPTAFLKDQVGNAIDVKGPVVEIVRRRHKGLRRIERDGLGQTQQAIICGKHPGVVVPVENHMPGKLMLHTQEEGLIGRVEERVLRVVPDVAPIIQTDRRMAPTVCPADSPPHLHAFGCDIRNLPLVVNAYTSQPGRIDPRNLDERTKADLRRGHRRRRVATTENGRAGVLRA